MPGLAETLRIAEAGESGTSHVVNVTDRNAADRLVFLCSRCTGQVEGVVNIAGIIYRFVPVAELSVDEMSRVMSVNFSGALNTPLAFLPELSVDPRQR